MDEPIRYGDWIEVSEAHAPIYLFRFQRTSPDEAFYAYLDYAIALHQRRQPFVMVYDLLAANMATPTQRAAQAKMLKDNRELTRQYCAGVAFVIASPMVRGVLTAILWLQPMACPYRVLGHVDVAMQWAHAQMGRMPAAVGSRLG